MDSLLIPTEHTPLRHLRSFQSRYYLGIAIYSRIVAIIGVWPLQIEFNRDFLLKIVAKAFPLIWTNSQIRIIFQPFCLVLEVYPAIVSSRYHTTFFNIPAISLLNLTKPFS